MFGEWLRRSPRPASGSMPSLQGMWFSTDQSGLHAWPATRPASRRCSIGTSRSLGSVSRRRLHRSWRFWSRLARRLQPAASGPLTAASMPDNRFDLTGRTALITGGAGLLGREHARALLDCGASVVLTDV